MICNYNNVHTQLRSYGLLTGSGIGTGAAGIDDEPEVEGTSIIGFGSVSTVFCFFYLRRLEVTGASDKKLEEQPALRKNLIHLF